MKSIVQDKKACLVCKTTLGLHKHHVFFGRGLRQISDKNGFWVWLCGRHHNLSNEGVHFNKELDNEIKKLTQHRYEEEHSRTEFMRLIGMNFL